jgi:archaeosine-15-forming tRNA-guanine transglycosylase
VLAVGKAVCGNKIMKKFDYGVAVKIREGIKSRNNQ